MEATVSWRLALHHKHKLGGQAGSKAGGKAGRKAGGSLVLGHLSSKVWRLDYLYRAGSKAEGKAGGKAVGQAGGQAGSNGNLETGLPLQSWEQS